MDQPLKTQCELDYESPPSGPRPNKPSIQSPLVAVMAPTGATTGDPHLHPTHKFLANQQNRFTNLPDRDTNANNIHKINPQMIYRSHYTPSNQGARAETPQELLGVSANRRPINLCTYLVCAYLSWEAIGCLKIKSPCFYLPSQVDKQTPVRKKKNKKGMF